MITPKPQPAITANDGNAQNYGAQRHRQKIVPTPGTFFCASR
jgi:hypothetical protein